MVVLFIAFIAIAVLKRRGRSNAETEWPYYAKRVLTQPEQILFHRLVKALPEHIVLAQVQVSRALGVKSGFNFHAWNNRINRLSYDFVICSKDSSVLAVIELDDGSHASQSRAETDRKKDSATASAGIRLIRWHVKSLPDEATIQGAFIKEPRPSIEQSVQSPPSKSNDALPAKQ